jgi:hypothetical protein
MSKAEQFRQYAEEAVRRAHRSKIEKEKQVLLGEARTWMQAALQTERQLQSARASNKPPVGVPSNRSDRIAARATVLRLSLVQHDRHE